MDDTPRTIDTPPQTVGPSRRTMVAGAAWAVPAIVAVTATPAFAVSAASVTATPDSYYVARDGSVILRALVKDPAGVPLAGKPVTFSGPSGTTFGPPTATTDSSGVAVTYVYPSNPTAQPGTTLPINATSGGVTATTVFTLLGANAYMIGYNAGAANGAATLTSPAPLKNAFPSRVKALTSGQATHYALLQDGTVWGVGVGSSGELGDGTTTNSTAWKQIPGLANVVQIAATESSAHALLSDGSVRSWGNNSNGQLGNGSFRGSTTPVSVVGFGSLTAAQISAGGASVYAVMSNGTVMSWGSNEYGQLGDGYSTTRRATAGAVVGISTAIQVAASYTNGYALLGDGTVRAWGYRNMTGSTQSPDGPYASTTRTPVTVQDLASATSIASTGGTGLALLTNGTVRTWGAQTALGRNPTTTAGDGTSAASAGTVENVAGATQISATYSTAYAVLGDGTVKAWGGNEDGQMGLGSTDNYTHWATTVPNLTNVALTVSSPNMNAFFYTT